MLDNPANSTAATDDANTAILVNLNISNIKHSEDLEELRQLAISDKLTILAEVKSKQYKPNPSTYAGKGSTAQSRKILRMPCN